MLAVSILAVAVLALEQAVVTAQRTTTEGLKEVRALELCEAMFEEIAGQPYWDPNGNQTLGPEAGETTRQKYTNMDDYHGLTEKAGAIYDARGTLYPTAYQGFTRSVSCAYTTLSVTGLSASINGLNVTVTVADSRGRKWIMTRFFAEPSP